jgi:hypothetical protein
MESFASNRVERGASDIAITAIRSSVEVDGGIRWRPEGVKEKTLDKRTNVNRL